MRQRFGPIRLLLAVLFSVTAFSAEYIYQTALIEGGTGQLVGIGIGLFVSIPLGVFVLIVQRKDLPRLVRLLIVLFLLFLSGILFLPAFIHAGIRDHDEMEYLVILLLFLAGGLMVAVMKYVMTVYETNQPADDSANQSDEQFPQRN